MDASQASARLAAGMPAMLLCVCANQYRISFKSDKDFLYSGVAFPFSRLNFSARLRYRLA